MRSLCIATAFLFFSVFAVVEAPGASADEAATTEFFETRVRPVLAENCYGCHGNAPLGGLRLDNAAGLMAGGSRGPAVIPGDADNSLLIKAVRHVDERLKMPMGIPKLSDAQIADLADWVAAGAIWPESTEAPKTASKDEYVIPAERKQFWSFVALAKPEAPKVTDSKWPNNEIDRFVLAKLESEGLKPVGVATKRDLLRRVTLDLTGLPPTLAEIEAFENDKSANAFEKVVDRLLASPHYGERWGRVWLDVARFGEDDYRSLNPNPRGYFPYPNAYMYRDWVIQAMNDDMPYDQFVRAQLAGDLLDEETRYKVLPATGFLGLGPWYFDNGAVEVTRADERHDRVDVVTRGFMGLTVACARCHNHKYDPIPQTDYYSLAGVFLDTDYHEYPRVPSATLEKYLSIKNQVEKKQDRLNEMQGDLSAQLSEARAYETANYLMGVWEVLGPQEKEKAAVVESRKLDYEQLERWIHYMERETNQYHAKDAFQAMLKKGGNQRQAQKLADEFQDKVIRVMLAREALDEENEIIYAQSLEGTKKKKKANKPNLFKTNDDFCLGCGLRLKNLPEEDNNLYTEIFQRELRDNEAEVDVNQNRRGNPGVLNFRGWGLESRLGADAKLRLDTLKEDVNKQKKELEPEYPYIHGVTDVEKPVDLELAIRGNPQNLGDKVPRHFLSVFAKGAPEPFAEGSGRLELANDILAQPITMRVIANRIWKGHFGTGIVDTPSNFGMGGERPTNPELLEYLASFFVENGMSMKALHKEIVMSRAYQLSTEMDDEDFAKDSGNRFYWRANRRRLDAEQLRDAILFVSGDLDDGMYGPSEELTPVNLRRTVYGRVSRYKLDTYLQLFDFPTPAISAEKRFTTTVPLQRLFLMNSDFTQSQAEKLVERVVAEPDSASRVTKMYECVYGRQPTAEEIKLALEYVRNEPMREYEEAKAKAAEAEAKRAKRGKGRGNKAAASEEGQAMEDSKAKAETTEMSRSNGSAPKAAMGATESGTTETGAELAKAGKAPDQRAQRMGSADGAAPPPSAGKDAKGAGKATALAKAKPVKAMEDATEEEKADDMEMGMGMMGGVMGRRGRGGPPQVEYDVTAWGRYAKILFSSSEFLFVN